ncbi:MAG: substrate-binding domain-containing protein, partial [Helicobacteraceae bacterium]|nr:substrate-binding domain-containing protein [Helicobacteraceae bacterium]
MRIKNFLKNNVYLHALIYAPIFAMIILFVALIIGLKLLDWGLVAESMGNATLIIAALLPALLTAPLGFFAARRRTTDDYFKTYFALFLPPIITLIGVNISYCLYIARMGLENDVLLTLLFLFGFAAFVYACFAIGFGAGLTSKKPVAINKKAIYISLFVIACELFVFAAQVSYKNSYTISQSLADTEAMYDSPNDRAITLNAPPTIYFENDLPKLDGATAFCPIFIAAAKAIYKTSYDAEEYLQCSATPYAYLRLYDQLRDDRADLIFVFAPSNEQLRAAREADVEFDLAPIGKEAFVFLVNEHNPIKSLTIKQLQKIYTGEITNWREVGGADEKILAFQRNENSGSQTTMENGVMKGLKLKKALEEEWHDEMSGLVRQIAHYRNAENAIGYSFRFFVTDMMKAQGVRLLAINGVEPTPENIQNGSYPL